MHQEINYFKREYQIKPIVFDIVKLIYEGKFIDLHNQ